MSWYRRNLRTKGGSFPEISDFLRMLDECLEDRPATSDRGLLAKLDRCLEPGEEVLIIPRRPRQPTLIEIAKQVGEPKFMLVICGSGNFAERALEALNAVHNRRERATSNFWAVIFLAVSWSGKNERQLKGLRDLLCHDYKVGQVCVKTPAMKGAPVRCQ